MFVTGQSPDRNFEMASQRLKTVNHVCAQSANVLDMLNSDFVIFTKEGLVSMEEILDCRKKNYFR